MLHRHDFAAEPLLLGLEAPLSAEAKAAARAAFERARAAPAGGPALCIATDVEPEGGDPDAEKLAHQLKDRRVVTGVPRPLTAARFGRPVVVLERRAALGTYAAAAAALGAHACVTPAACALKG